VFQVFITGKAHADIRTLDIRVTYAYKGVSSQSVGTFGAHRGARYKTLSHQESVTPPREFPTPFSPEIVDAVIPTTLIGPKVTFTGMEDLEAHLMAFHTQMMLVGGSDAARCKLFMSTLAGTVMEWFISLPDGHVMLFLQLTKLFRAQYLAN